MAMNKIFQTHDDLYIFKVLKTVIESENRKQGLLHINSQGIENKPDIILLDLIKPHHNGIQLANNIKNVFDEIPVLVMASQQQSQDKLALLNEELLNRFYHEIRKDELLKWIKNYLNCHSQFEPMLFYENLILSQLREILGNWKKAISEPFPGNAISQRDIYLDALF
ncbi:hypothetical protein L0Z72_10065, partial [candidate division KSB1 bacterium]|nr:hypothetical protein [candidate division KSB1 bacterium]